MLKARKPVTA